ncbi:transmembrane protease serine 9-like [Anopheles ziemanni]|uniref:transmembrane protease serine 9-like n=1 Tax=Anopheles coustani TaxID=139045 RepID=UPI00265927F1|nr:transmembrane protease serine 9-like [Anopheles coustani]XP_058170387.1 transmembrane protease serine 9-like [Anopheles ziemanni]
MWSTLNMLQLWLGLLLWAIFPGAVRCDGAKVLYRIVNGSTTDIAHYPFMVSIQRWELDTKTHLCGGTLISNIWILTAGHCIEEELSGIVRVESSFHASGGALLTINRTVRHEKLRYGRTGIDFDFGLIKLSTSVERAVPVHLVADRRRFPAGELCSVVGWGITKGTGERDQLRSVRIPIVKQAQCADIYNEVHPITGRMVCAGYAEGGRDACEGDSGGPLICRGIQAGITSWGMGCAKPNRFGVYSNIGDQLRVDSKAHCGERQMSFRIVNGTETTVTAYPYIVSVHKWTPLVKQHLCGGTLISESWILTAAHCTDKLTPQTAMVRANSSFYKSGGKLHRVVQVIKHPNFTYVTGDYDFGLLKLRDRYRRAVVAKLPTGSRRFPPGERCTAMGWGYTQGRESRDQLRKVVLPIVPQQICRKAYEATDEITARMICAGYAEGLRDACDGDSGGPLICRGIQAGVISWAIGCAKPNMYGVYSDIAAGRQWIRNQTGI